MSGVNEKPCSFTHRVAAAVSLGMGVVLPALSADAISTSTAIVATPNPAAVRSPITLTAVVSPAPSGGTVSFTDNVEPIAACESLPLSGDRASCTVSYPITGAHTIVASYSGTTGFTASTSPALNEIVTPVHCATLAGCNLSGTDVTGLDFRGANLSGADLSEAYLTRVDLTGANLTAANLSNANLDGSNLSGATLAGARTTGATFKHAIWSSTICPDGTRSDAHGEPCGARR